MATYNAADIIGKTLIARSPVAVYRSIPNGPVVFTVKPGQGVGVVYSWVNKDGNLYWMFYDAYKRPYYTKHSGAIDTGALESQGVLTTKEKIEKEQKANETTREFVSGLVKDILIGVGIYLLAKPLIGGAAAKIFK